MDASEELKPALPPKASDDSTSAPDVAEAASDDIDNVIPTRGYNMIPMVGLGGSFGAIPALQTFFAEMPAKTGMVFVVMLHLSPEHESSLADLLQRSTTMPVLTATDGVKVEANHVYVIPPARHLISADGHLRLEEFVHTRGRRVAVDLFLRTMADTHGPHAAAIILSGGDGDGAIGIKRIKERGGLTIAQDPSQAEASGMPRAAIATGMVDWVLPVEQMPSRLLGYRRLEHRLKLPPEEGAQLAPPAPLSVPEAENALREILGFLHTRTGRDFSDYKRATILRRISRRMQVNGVDDLPSYLGFLRTNPGESGALLQDMLISVTNFFRDRDAFRALEARVPELFTNKGPNDTVRVWVAACATGEEAYSIAMLLCEHARKLDAAPLIQIFATDLNDEVIPAAREAIYPEAISADVSEERLRRFFVKDERGYRMRREVREIVLFAQHDLLKDSPFSRLDLISCRNLLIYLNRAAQERALEIFHFALRPQGKLFLGSSEAVDEGSPLFTVLDKKHRLFARRVTPRTLPMLALGPGTLALALEAQERARDRPTIPGRAFDKLGAVGPSDAPVNRDDSSASWAELHLKLIERLAPPSLIVNANHDILHLSENVGQFLEFSGGEPTRNLLGVVHPMLRIELRAALYRAAQTGTVADACDVPVELKTGACTVNLRVAPLKELGAELFLIVFDARAPGPIAAPVSLRSEPDAVAQHLEHELERMKAHLRDNDERHEASTEELKASNEELQAMNEELRSATEELETSREELQSINEELTTVNHELKSKVDELGHANSDLHNLMASTAIATVFLDRDLRVMRYTPSAVALFNLIPTDLGRPLTDLKARLDYRAMEEDARRVLEHLLPVEREVKESGGKWFLARLLPYRTTEDRVAGIVLTFVDITDRVLGEARLRRAMQVETVGIVHFNSAGQIVDANDAFLRMNGFSREDLAHGRLRRDELTSAHWTPRSLEEIDKLKDAGGTSSYEQECVRKDGTRWWGLFCSARIGQDEGIEYVVDVTESKRAHENLEWGVQQRTAELASSNRALSEEIVDRKRAERDRQEAMQQVVGAEENERSRISRGLHDEVGQHITALLLDLKAAESAEDPAVLRTKLQAMRAAVEEIGREIHDLALELRATALDDLGLVRALANYLDEWSARTHVRTDFHHTGFEDARLSRPLETALFRITGEALNNVVRHAKAKEVSIILERSADQAVAIIEDDGEGFDISAQQAGNGGRLGLITMRERATLLGGEVTIESNPGKGTTVFIRLPLLPRPTET